MEKKTDYLGDGVYAEQDEFGSIWLRANAPDSDKEVCLEPAVYANLVRFAARCKEGK